MTQLFYSFVVTMLVFVSRATKLYQIELLSKLQAIYDTECIEGTLLELQEFSKDKQNLFKNLDFTEIKKNCLPLYSKIRIQHNDIGSLFRYGNWCGENYGGFDNHCKESCQENQWYPSADCIKCNPPVDYVDQQCMYHDFCMERFQVYHIGNGSACANTKTLGEEFLTPCSCPINITQHLLPIDINEDCVSFDCRLNGGLIYDVFTSSAMTCTCTFDQCDVKKHNIRVKHLDSQTRVEDCPSTQDCTTVSMCLNHHKLMGLQDEGEIPH